jgi:cyclohexanecarboxylate-CoA ligase
MLPPQFPRVSAQASELYGQTGIWDGRLLDTWLDDAVDRFPQRAAIVDGAACLSYTELGDRVIKATAGLRGLGVRRGDVVSFQLPNWWEALVLQLAILRVGAVSNPLMPILRERELRFMLDTARSRVLIVAETFRGYDHAALAERIRADLPTLEHVVVVRGNRAGALAFADLLGDTGDGSADRNRHPNDPVVLLYTSGTESEPKGVVHSHNTLGYEVRSILKLYSLTGDDVVFMPSPIAHITGVLYGFHLATLLASTVVYQDVWEPERALQLVRDERCSFVVAATPFLHGLTYHQELIRYDVSSLRIFACGGADVPPDLIRAACERLGCVTVRVYGSTEFPTLTAGAVTDPLEKRATTDGRPIGLAEARVITDDGAPAGPGVVGDLFARGPEAFLGYLGRPSNSCFTDDGWFDTGDRALVDAEGYVQIVGRSKDIIVRGGENLSAKEIEDLLYAHPDIREVAIVAIPDMVLVERACAVVVPRTGSNLRLADLVEFLGRLGIAKQKYPERLEIVDVLPRTPTGKVQKFRLREHVAARMAREQVTEPGSVVPSTGK